MCLLGLLNIVLPYATYSLTHLLCMCVCTSICLLASVVWIGAARLDQQANHLPVYNSHHATLRCSQTPIFSLPPIVLSLTCKKTPLSF